MKRALIIAAALSLLLPDIAMAQSNQPPPRPAPGAPGRPQPGQPNRAPQPGKPNRPSLPGQPNRPPQSGRPNHPSPGQPNHPSPGRPPAPRPTPPGRPGFRPPPVSVRPLPPRGNQFWHRGQYYGRVRGPSFAYPPGWNYRQWTIGQRLPSLFLAPTYVYPGWATLGLQQPAPGYVWVRFGPDLLLVNQSTDEVEDVVYGAFM